MICCCSLAGSVACRNCSRWKEYYGDNIFNYPKNDWTEIGQYGKNTLKPEIHKIKKTIEKFDKDGKLIERIITEE